MDPWAVLGVPPGSSDRAIRQAYLRLSRLRHPDMGGTDEGMQELNAAYQAALSAPEPPPPFTPPFREHISPDSGDRRSQFTPPAPVVRIRKPKKPLWKRKWPYAAAALFALFLATSGATNEPTPQEKPAIYGLIGRCVELVNREITELVPCAGPHDAWVVDVIGRPGTCPPLANNFLNEISHIICINTDK